MQPVITGVEKLEPLPLFWESTYAIALALMAQYPECDPQQVGLHELVELVQKLPGFADDPAIVSTQTLLDIYNVWYEEKTAL